MSMYERLEYCLLEIRILTQKIFKGVFIRYTKSALGVINNALFIFHFGFWKDRHLAWVYTKNDGTGDRDVLKTYLNCDLYYRNKNYNYEIKEPTW